MSSIIGEMVIGRKTPKYSVKQKEKQKCPSAALSNIDYVRMNSDLRFEKPVLLLTPQNYVTASYPIRAFNIYVKSLQTREWGAFKAFQVCCQRYRLYHMRTDLPCPLQSVCQRHALTLAPRRVSPLRGRHGHHSHVSQADAACQLPWIISQWTSTVVEWMENRH
jgi:hypothetical protein